MKSIYHAMPVRMCAAALIAVSLFAPAALHALEITFMVGSVSLTRGGKTSAPAVRTRLASGDTLTTGKGSLADLALADGSQIKVMENSSIRFSGDIKDRPDSVSVIAGIVESKFKKLAKGSQSRIITPTTVCSVRGTEFHVAVSDSGDSRIDMQEGAVELRNPYGKTAIRNRQQSSVRMNDKPAAARESAGLEQWKEQRDRALDENPREQGGRIKTYLGTMNDRSAKTSDRISGLGSDLRDNAPRTKRALKKSGTELDRLDEEVKDDLYLSEATNESLGRMSERFSKGQGDIRELFTRLKEESDRVCEQKRKNYESIQAVKAAYRKAYDEIMGTMNTEREKIRRQFDEQRETKPE
ncbi:MAG TPA: FecR family protein [Spirochaetota bacterium]|nr:FecR family protein [Spirochaetota bacterium]HNT09681.1 FecR family protein [Spirochaetota bacterium]